MIGESGQTLVRSAANVAPWMPPAAALELQRRLGAASFESQLQERTLAMVSIAHWLGATDGKAGSEGIGARLTVLVLVLDRAPQWRERLVRLVASVLADTNAVPFFADTGLPSGHRFFSSAINRLTRRFLPEAPHERDLAELVGRLLPGKSAGDWFEQLPCALLSDCAEMFGAETWAPIRVAMGDAMTVLSLRVAALGLNPELRARGADIRAGESAFVRLVLACRSFAVALQPESAAATVALCRTDCLREIEGCRALTRAVQARLEEFGVSVDLVYHLELIEGHLSRMETMIPLLSPVPGAERGIAARRLIAHLARAKAREQSIAALISSNIDLLTRKVIERAGATGEHYITSTRAEYREMWRSALGGGAFTTLTVVVKIACYRMRLAPFFEGLFPSLNYAGSFLALQFLGFTLATKQPSVTAAALAGSLRESNDGRELDGLVDQISRITRSQLAAVIGNLTAVTAGALAFHFVYTALFGRPYLDAKETQHAFDSLNPLHSGAIVFAMMTGFLLWLSSIVAGWLENWAVYRKLPEAIARHRTFGRAVGVPRMERASKFFARNISGIGGNVSLGFMLGMLPTFGKFFGIPLEVRHVTLSTGNLALATATTPRFWNEPAFWWAVCGLGLIGLMNFAVSFSLALAVAIRARRVPPGTLRRLARAIGARFGKSPGEFFYPPRDRLADASAAPSS